MRDPCDLFFIPSTRSLKKEQNFIRIFFCPGCWSVAVIDDIPNKTNISDGTMIAAKETSPPPLQSMNLESPEPAKTFDQKNLLLQGPQFIAEASKNVTALAGRVASLNCRIKNLDNWTVVAFPCKSFRFSRWLHNGRC